MTLQVGISIQSTIDSLELVQMVLEETMTRLELEDRVSYQVGMAVREAVANAIKHGNGLEPDKKVHVEFDLQPGEVIVRVSDEGEGFDPGQVPDPLLPSGLLKPGGRGLLFMREFMDEIDYTFHIHGGTEVTLRKQLALGASETT